MSYVILVGVFGALVVPHVQIDLVLPTVIVVLVVRVVQIVPIERGVPVMLVVLIVLVVPHVPIVRTRCACCARCGRRTYDSGLHCVLDWCDSNRDGAMRILFLLVQWLAMLNTITQSRLWSERNYISQKR